MVEDWDSTAGQLRLSKITGTPSAPVFTGGIQFPQSANSWRFDASRISNKTTATTNGTTVTSSGGYVPQRQQSANLPSGTRVAANDSRMQNAVYRNGTLWCAHTVMLSASPQAAGQTIGGSGNPVDTHSGIQWWAIDPSIESAASTAPVQRGRIEDPAADNCHNGLGGQNIIAGRCTSTATQTGEFYAFPNISVNQNNDVLIGFTRFTPLTYPNSAYVIRRAGDTANTVRDAVIFRPGQANYNIGSGTSTATHPSTPSRNNRWGDYSAAQTDPVNDTDFWTIQEYSGTVRDFGIGLAGNWETWWAKVSPGATQPVQGATVLISEFRLRGPQGVRDEFVELYNPTPTPVIVSTTDGSEGWALGYSTTGAALNAVVAIVPNGTVIPPHGHFLIADNPDAATAPTAVYSLNTAAATQARGADSDTGWSLDLPDNGGLALFSTATTANMTAGTRLDSVGFSTTAAGLFKEGNGIPAVTSTTPTGQMTFVRRLNTGVPADTNANENDFVFLNPVVGETLGSTPTLGAAGPENLDGPTHGSGSTTLPATVIDSGVGAGSAPNLVRNAGAVANGAFGTLSLRRTFTNNTGSSLSRLRFRIVDLTTSPAAGPFADLRALSASSTTVSVSGGGTVNLVATTLETPPAQVAGGGLNGTLAVPSITNTSVLTSGSTVSLQFTLGVQVTGQYNFCLVPEGDAMPSSAPLCFAGTTENAVPVIVPASPVGVVAGGPTVAGASIATVSDTQDAAGSLGVAVIASPVGISVTNLVNTAGAITADVSASCSAPSGDNSVTLQVTDSEGATSNATLTVSVTPTPAPATPTIGGPTSTCAGTPVTLTATSAGATSFQWYLDGNPLGGETASTTSASTGGSYTVEGVNTCGTSAQSAPFELTVNPIPATPTISGTAAFCTGGNTTLSSSSASGNQWFLNGNPINSATGQDYIVTAAGDYTVVVTLLGCSSASSAVTSVVENPIPATPTIGTTGSTTFCAGGSVTLSSSSASGNQWYLEGNPIGGATGQQYIATANGTYTVVVTSTGCSSAASAGLSVTVNPIPATPTITPGGPTTFCTGGSVTLTSSSASGNQWYLDGNPIGGQTGQQYIATANGNYTVTVTASSCSSAQSAATTVTVNPIPAAPTITPGGPTTFCAGGSVTLTSSSASGNQWFLDGNPIGGATAQQYVANANGSYTVTVTTTGCTSAQSAATVVTVNPIPATPTITPGGPTSFCAGGSVTLTSSSASGNQWYLNGSPIGGQTAQQYIATASGDYTVGVTTSGCSSAQSAVTSVLVNPIPSATITAPGSIVAGSTGNVATVPSAGAGATYAWSVTNGSITAGQNTNSLTFTAGVAGSFTINVTVTSGAGCGNSGSAGGTVTASLPSITVTSITPNNGPVFGNTPVTVHGTGFLAGATLTLGGTAATNVVVVNSTTITAKTAAHAGGAVNVVVTNTNTASGTLTNGFTYRPQNFDPNGDNDTDPSDIFYLVNYFFMGGPPPSGTAGMLSGDANGDSIVDPADIFYAVHFLYTNGPAPLAKPGDATSTSSGSFRGAVTLGNAQSRGGRWFVPVTVTLAAGSPAPDSLALQVRFSNPAGDASAHHVGDLQPVFEINRSTANTLSYLVSFDDRAPLLAGDARSFVIAEIEVASGTAARLEIDPVLTMLTTNGGQQKATIATGTLQVRGTTIGSPNATPRRQAPDGSAN